MVYRIPLLLLVVVASSITKGVWCTAAEHSGAVRNKEQQGPVIKQKALRKVFLPSVLLDRRLQNEITEDSLDGFDDSNSTDVEDSWGVDSNSTDVQEGPGDNSNSVALEDSNSSTTNIDTENDIDSDDANATQAGNYSIDDSSSRLDSDANDNVDESPDAMTDSSLDAADDSNNEQPMGAFSESEEMNETSKAAVCTSVAFTLPVTVVAVGYVLLH